MSIYNKKGELEPHSYEKLLVGARVRMDEILCVWIEGTKTELSFKPSSFGMVGGAINTNAGMSFTKDQLLEIISIMKEGAIFKVAACNSLDLIKLEEEFIKDNDMVQINANTFIPSKNLNR